MRPAVQFRGRGTVGSLFDRACLLVCVSALSLLLFSCARVSPEDTAGSSEARVTDLTDALLTGEHVWQGEVRIRGTVRLAKDGHLVIRPGTTVLFAEKAGLLIEGSVEALGVAGQRIVFTALEKKEAGSWGEIVLQEAGESRFENCDFRYARWAVHSHFTRLTVRGCTFRNGYGGMRFRSGPLVVTMSLFADNTIGLRSYQGLAEIRENQITRNRKGVFVREKGGGLLITKNNIFANTDYNVWVGDFNTEDIPAPSNWWGKEDPVERIFDARREPGIGLVLIEPVLAGPLDFPWLKELPSR